MFEDDEFFKNKNQNKNIKITIKEFQNHYLQVYKGDSYYLLDRNKYDINSIMMKIDLKKLNILGEKFRKHENGVEKIEFIRLIKNELNNNFSKANLMEEANLVYGLYKFFCEIDFNGDGHMQWEEFTQFIIDTVEGESGKINDDEENGKIINERIMQKYKRYELSKKVKEYYIHKTEIIDAAYFFKSNLLLIIEYKTQIIKIYNPVTGRIIDNLDIIQECKKYKNSYLNNNDINSNNNKNNLSKKNLSQSNSFKNIKKTQNQLNQKNNNKIQNNNGGFQNDNYYNKNLENKFSILSIFSSTFILAVCLSNNQILFFSFNSDGKSELLYSITTPSLQKKIWFLPEHNIWLSSGMKEKGEIYYYLNELDVQFEIKNQKVEILYNLNHPYRNRYCTICEHKDEIYDVIEILKPFLILTACLDSKIRLINIEDKEYLKMWNYHSLGVRHLDYNSNLESNGIIISSGFEYFINIYNTDLSIEESYKGKLEGHYSPVVNSKFLSNSQMIVSVDEEGIIRIWDVKLKLCLQMIPLSKKNLKVNNLIFLNKLNRFIIYGNKMLYYDSKYKNKKKVEKNFEPEDNYPLNVSYNKYYQQFFVTTTKDIRIYNKHGDLEKTFRKCRENEHFDNDVKIRYFTFDNKHRKFYLGFSNGAIMQYNAGNGSLIKSINEHEIEKEGIQTYVYDHTKEISSLFFFYQYKENDNNNFILISTGLDSLINVYNEINPEETEKLRTISGGHTVKKKLAILTMDFSLNLCLMATGSTNGLIVIWNFELSKIDEVLFKNSNIDKNKIDVLCLKFLEKYPLLFSSFTDGSCIIWGVSNFGFNNKLILNFQNFNASLFRVELSNVSNAIFINREMEKIETKILFNKYFCNDEISIQRRNEIVYDQISGEPLPPLVINEEYKYNKIDKNFIPDTKDKKNNQYYLYICDEGGYIKILDLKGIFKKFGKIIEKNNQVEVRSNFNILKKEDLNFETILNHNIQNYLEKNIKENDFFNLYENKIIIREWKGHLDFITGIEKIDDPFCLITISLDQYMKLWNEKCECIGEINVLPKLTKSFHKCTNWSFKIDEKKILEEEIKEVVKIFEEINVQKIKIGSVEDVKVKEMNFEEKNEKKSSYIPPPLEYKKNRFKQILKENKNITKKIEEINEENLNQSYEGLYLIDITKKIENIINKKPEKIGMNEIANKLIDTLNMNKEKPKEKKKINLDKKDFFDVYNSKINEVSPKSKGSLSSFNIFNGNNFKKTLNKVNSFNNSNFNNSWYSKNSGNKINKSRISTPNPKKIRRIPSGFKSTLYSQKLIDEEIKKKNLNENKLILPKVKKKNLKNSFVKQTKIRNNSMEKMLKYEFYYNSYKKCCELNPNQNILNDSIALNYKSMWDNVKAYGRKDDFMEENKKLHKNNSVKNYNFYK